MKVYNVEQGTPAWMALRAGIPTASEFHRFITPAKLERSKSESHYMARLLAERITGRPIEETDGEGYQSPWMKRGSDIESQAISAYQFETDCEVTRVGFCTTDDGLVGASPDGLILAAHSGGLEMKSPSLAVHVEYLLNPQALVNEYRLQCYGQLLVGEGCLNWVDLVSYHPKLPLVVVRLNPYFEPMGKVKAAVSVFCQDLAAAYKRLEAQHGPFTPTVPAQGIASGLSAEDEELIVRGLREQGRL
jgi:hypothetical protein